MFLIVALAIMLSVYVVLNTKIEDNLKMGWYIVVGVTTLGSILLALL